MTAAGATTPVVLKHFHLFCGLGGGAKGFNRGHARVGRLEARYRCIGGVDVDPASIRDFSRAAKVQGTVLDLFSREQFTAFHGKEPPAGWRLAMPTDIRAAAGGEFPDVVFLSAPCKGFSGLLPEASSQTPKYQALNGLTLRGVWPMLEAFKDELPKLIVFENVPRIAKRGRHLIDQIVAILRSAGYAVSESAHDCGVLGGLAQSRKRFLLVARHQAKIPPFLYEPPEKRLRGVGEILEKLPLPGDPRGGVMHRMPALQWKTWVRLAFVEAGSDWRSLNKLRVADGVLSDFGIVPSGGWRDDILGVLPWSENSGTITGNAGATTGRFNVADPRGIAEPHNGALGVKSWTDSSGVITSNGRPASGPFSVADPRPVEQSDRGNYGVNPGDQPAGVVTSQRSPGQGTFSVADPRVDGHEKSVQLGVGQWDQPSAVIKGDVSVGTGRYAVSDPRFNGSPHFSNVFRIVSWNANAGAVTAGQGPTSGGQAVADPRLNWSENAHASKLAVQNWDQPGRTIGGARFGSGGGAVADPRPAQREDYQQNKYRVTEMDEAAGAVIAASTTGNGAFAVADPRPPAGLRNGVHGVHGWEDSAGTVAGESLPPNGAFSVADPRPVGLNANREAYVTGGHYGVVPWEQTAGAVPANAKNNNGPWSVADPRQAVGDSVIELPRPEDRLVAVIRALDGTWHRPFTTLELASLQSLVDPDELFELDGKSDSAWRERIGNAVPPDAAQAIANVMATTILLAMAGETFVMSSDRIWVQPLMIALAVDHSPNDGLLG